MKRRDFFKLIGSIPFATTALAGIVKTDEPVLDLDDDDYYIGEAWHNDLRAEEAREFLNENIKDFEKVGLTICGPVYYKEEDGEIKELHPGSGCKHGYTAPAAQAYLAYWNNSKKYPFLCSMCTLVRNKM